MRTTLAQVRSSRIPGILGKCPTSPDIVSYINEVVQRLLPQAKWVNTYQRMIICAEDGNITWPRCVSTVEAVGACERPMVIRNEWFEFVENGIGIQKPDGTDGENCGCPGLQLLDRGTSCTIEDIDGTKVLRVYADNSADVGKRILFKAKDENGNKIYGSDVEGFYVTLAYPYIQTTQQVTSIYGIIKDATLGNVRVYQYNTIAASQSLILNAEPDELTPDYRRSLVKGLQNITCCTDCDPDAKITVSAEVKLQYIPVSRDTDFLTIGWIPALKEMAQSVRYAEMDSMEAKQKAQLHEARAFKALDDELKHYLGDGATVPVEIESRIWGMRIPQVY